MGITQLLFWALTAVSLFSALMVITSKNPVYSVLWLIVTFFTISGHYLLLNAQFLAIVNIIVYAGAIMVLFLFVIMLMNLSKDTEPAKKQMAEAGRRCCWWLFVAGAGCSLARNETRMTEMVPQHWPYSKSCRYCLRNM
jgi:NADH-quinone oxidoreductase subunit J